MAFSSAHNLAESHLRSTTEAHVKLSITNVAKSFVSRGTKVVALGPLSLEIEDGSFVCIVGPSGCGKTTLLRMIAGLDFPSEGEIQVDSSPVTGPGPDRMVLFQESALFPWLTALQNVAFGLKLDEKVAPNEVQQRALSYLSLVGLEQSAHKYVHELSGGMKQRVALARALAPQPGVLLMDEPFASLDALTREQLYADLQAIWEAQRATILLVTHNVREAACLASRVLIMSASPGRLCGDVQVDAPRPRNMNSLHTAETASRLSSLLRAGSSRIGLL